MSQPRDDAFAMTLWFLADPDGIAEFEIRHPAAGLREVGEEARRRGYGRRVAT